MPITNDELAAIRAVLTGESERAFKDAFTDAQAAAIMAAICEIVPVTDIFTPAQLLAWANTTHATILADATFQAHIAAHIEELDDVAGIISALGTAGWTHA